MESCLDLGAGNKLVLPVPAIEAGDGDGRAVGEHLRRRVDHVAAAAADQGGSVAGPGEPIVARPTIEQVVVTQGEELVVAGLPEQHVTIAGRSQPVAFRPALDQPVVHDRLGDPVDRHAAGAVLLLRSSAHVVVASPGPKRGRSPVG